MDPASFNTSGELSSLTNAITGISRSSSTIIVKVNTGYLVLIKPKEQSIDFEDVLVNKLREISDSTIAIATGLKGDCRFLLSEVQNFNIAWKSRFSEDAPALTLANLTADFIHNFTMNNYSARRPLATILTICDVNESKIHEVNIDGSFKRVFVSCNGSDPHNLFLKIEKDKSFANALSVDAALNRLKEIAQKDEVINSYVTIEYSSQEINDINGELVTKGQIKFLNAQD